VPAGSGAAASRLKLVTGIAALAVNNFGDTRSGGLAGPMALLIIVLLVIATVLLIRNMNARLRRLPERFPGQDGPGPDGPAPDGDRPDGAAADLADHPRRSERPDPTGPDRSAM
jgi:hypothetical protein